MSNMDGFNLQDRPEWPGSPKYPTAPPEGRRQPARLPNAEAFAGQQASAARNTTIDLFRVIAIFGVILVHTDPVTRKVFTSAPEHLANLMITGAGRLAVPFFFVVSGYFFGRKLRAGAPPLPLFARYAKRLLRIWVLWSLVYLLIPLRLGQWQHQGWWPAVVEQFRQMAAHPTLIVFVGGKGHLWFLMALVMALAMVAVCEKLRARWLFHASAIALYACGLLSGLYANTAAGFSMPFDPRNGPFMSALLVACGYWVAGHDARIDPVVAFAVTAIGLVGFEAELHWVPMLSGAWPPIIDYGLSTPVFGIGALLLGLAMPGFGGRWWPRVGAEYVLGIYVCHELFVEPAWILHAWFHSFAWEFLFPVIVFALALGLTALLARERRLRWLVR
jgi:surface polysaccharide O-acyltransferase-like enzyme